MPTTTPMKIKLNDVHVVDECSEETLCFSAKLEVDGTLIASVSNDGKGGCHRYHWSSGVTAVRRAEIMAEMMRRGEEQGATFEKEDAYINHLVADHQLRETFERFRRGGAIGLVMVERGDTVEFENGRIAYSEQFLVPLHWDDHPADIAARYNAGRYRELINYMGDEPVWADEVEVRA